MRTQSVNGPDGNVFSIRLSHVLRPCVPQFWYCSWYSLAYLCHCGFWRTLYLPEIQQHARHLAVELELVNNPNIRIFHRDSEVDVDTWLRNRVGIEYVTNPKEYPSVRDKIIAEFLPTVEQNWQMKLAQKTLLSISNLNLAHVSGFKHQKCMVTGFVNL